jgi:PAS domain S-box-containing protein
MFLSRSLGSFEPYLAMRAWVSARWLWAGVALAGLAGLVVLIHLALRRERDRKDLHGRLREADTGLDRMAEAMCLERQEAEARLQELAKDLEVQVAARTAALQESEARVQGFLRHAPAAIAIKGLDGRLLLVNRRAETLIGTCLAATPGKAIEDLFPPDVVARVRAQDEQVLRDRQELQVEEQVAMADGSLRDYLIQKFPLVDPAGCCWGLGVIATNITERKRCLRAQVQRQKLESLSLFAGGLAHDFNNLLGAMVGNVDLARLELGPSGHFEALDQLIGRAAGLVEQILAYAGLGQAEVRTLDLNQVVEDAARLLRASLPRNVMLRLEPWGEPLPLEGDPVQLQQVVLNLVLNAAEAMANEDPGGSITLGTRSGSFDQAALDSGFQGQGLEPGFYRILEVTDPGPGIQAQALERIFDPFFSTKNSGRGLGLAAVQGILKAHHGGCQVASVPGTGCAFTILLPAMPSRDPEQPAPEALARTFQGTGTVLVVDDEDALRNVAVAALRRMGFTTLEARDGVEAVRAYEENWDRIRLILLDLTMPRMGGGGGLPGTPQGRGHHPHPSHQRFRVRGGPATVPGHGPGGVPPEALLASGTLGCGAGRPGQPGGRGGVAGPSAKGDGGLDPRIRDRPAAARWPAQGHRQVLQPARGRHRGAG